MSLAATDVFLKFGEDSDALGVFGSETIDFFPEKFERIESVDESMMACMRDGPMIVLSAAGMLTGGRVLHHLKKRLPDEKNAVVFVGYQAEGSKGRYLQEFGSKEGNIRIFHETVQVNAEVCTVASLSAHADPRDLLDWIGRFQRPPQKIYVNHGSQSSSRALASAITGELGIPAVSVVDEKKFQF
jgi:metallo-beta-lactamase family protein